MSLRLHEIAEAGHRILNPFTDEKLALLGRVCRLQAGQRQLDLGCGKGEMLCRWASEHDITGVGVDVSEVFLAAARTRAKELGVENQVHFEHANASVYVPDSADFDIVSCIGATWIGGGLVGTIELLRRHVADNGLILVGEPYWSSEPPSAARDALSSHPEEFASLGGTLDRFADAGVELLEMVLADGDSWDRYVAAQWWTISDWLRANEDDPDAPAMRQFLDRERHVYLSYTRTYLGWGVFVLRPLD